MSETDSEYVSLARLQMIAMTPNGRDARRWTGQTPEQHGVASEIHAV